MTRLGEIVEHKRQEVSDRGSRLDLEEIKRRAESGPEVRPVHFGTAVSLIAEVKRRSPSKGDLMPDVDPIAQARAYEQGGAAVISVLTDERYFSGSFADLDAVRAAVQIPVLCKDFVLTPYQVYEARSHGADLLLLIVAAIDDEALVTLQGLILNLGMLPLVEVHDQHDLARALAADTRLIGINNRDLTDFSVDLVTTEYLAPLVPDDVVAISESGIATREDVERVTRAGARAILVGEALMLADDPAATIRELLR